MQGALRHYVHEVELEDGSTVGVLTNLSEADLEKYFPAPAARRAWLVSLARQSTLPRKRIRR